MLWEAAVLVKGVLSGIYRSLFLCFWTIGGRFHGFVECEVVVRSFARCGDTVRRRLARHAHVPRTQLGKWLRGPPVLLRESDSIAAG